jgi:hypothetical protein
MNQALKDSLAAARLTAGDGELPDWSRIILLQNLAGVPTTRQLTNTYIGSLGFNFMILGSDGRPSHFCKCRPLANARLRHELAVLTTLGADQRTRQTVPRTWGVKSEELQLLISEYIQGTSFDRSVVNLSAARWVDSMTEILDVESRVAKTVAHVLPERVEGSVSLREAASPCLSYLASAGLLEADAVNALDQALRLGGRVEAHPQHGDLWPQNIVESRGSWWLLDFEAFGDVVVPLYDAWHLLRTCSDLRRHSARKQGSTPELWIDRLAGRGDESAASWHTISVAAREHGLDSKQIVAGLVFYVSHIATEFHKRGGPRWYWNPHIREARRLANALPELEARCTA